MTKISPSEKLKSYIKITGYALCVSFIVFFALVFFYPFKPQVVTADTWIDEDGGAAIHISDNSLSIHSMDDFYYFEKVYRSAIDNQKIRLCIGPDNGKGMAQDCFQNVVVIPASYAKEKNHSLIFDITKDQSSFIALKQSLRKGNTMKVSVDDGILYAAYYLHSDHKLDEQYAEMLIWTD